MPKFDEITFIQLLNAGDMKTLLEDGGKNLTKDQLKQVKQLGKEQSKQKLMEKQAKVGRQPGFSNSILFPVMKKLFQASGGAAGVKPQKKDPTLASEGSSGGKTTKIKQKTKETAQNLAKVMNNDSLETFSKTAPDVEILGAVYKMMVITYNDNKLQNELDDNAAESRYVLREQRHKEIIEALGALSFGTSKTLKTPGLKKEPEVSVGNVPAAEVKTPKMPSSKVPSGTKGGTAGTPPKVSGTPPVPSVGKGAVAVATGVGILGTVSSQMAKAETKGPDAYTQANIVGKEGPEHQIKKGNKDVTTGKPFTKDLTEMSIGEVVALGERRRKYYKGRGGSAMGRYQFIPGTLKEQAQKAFGQDWMNVPFTKDNQDILNGQFLKSNAQKLTDAGVPVNTATLYMMHFLGDAAKVGRILSSPDNSPMSSFMSTSEIRMNPAVATMSVGQYKEHLRTKGYDYNSIDNKTLQSEPLYNKPASSINSSTLENQSLNESLNQPMMVSSTVNQNNFNMFQPQHRPNTNQSMDDRSAFERKSRFA